MKTELNKEQSQHLIDLGVPITKATALGPLYKREDGLWDNRRLFSITDFLNGGILPKEIVYYEDYNSEFTLQWNCSIQKWDVGYMYNTGFWKKTRYSFEELIDALYELACWYYGEFKKQGK